MLLTITKVGGEGRNFNALKTVLMFPCSFKRYCFYLQGKTRKSKRIQSAITKETVSRIS